MSKLISIIFVHVLSIISVMRLYLSLPQATQAQSLWIGGVTSVSTIIGLAIVYELVAYQKSAPTSIRFFKERRIRSYMRKWLLAGGRTVIFTRDMSWVNTPKVKQVLMDKARKRELIVCIEQMIPLAEELERAGAEVVQYGDLDVAPRSRYTIIDFGKDKARVAVGGGVGKRHIIQEFGNGEHPFFGVADDLARVLIAYKRQSNDTPS
jgi:hypothetical protein